MFNPMQTLNPGIAKQNPMMQAMQMMGNLGNIQNNPMFQRARMMAEGKSEEELQQIACNLCAQRGIDFNGAMHQFQQFQQMFGGFR